MTSTRRPANAPGRDPLGFVCYVDGDASDAATVDELARLSAAAIDAGAETCWLRARTAARGERTLSRDEQLAVLLAMSHLPPLAGA
jgi:hypothetical protein